MACICIPCIFSLMNSKIDCVVVGPIETNCWLYPLEEEADKTSGDKTSGEKQCCVIIDPGDEAGRIISRLLELDWVPKYIFISHGHFDHIMALPGLIEASRKGVFGPCPMPKIGIHRLDAHYFGKPMPEANILFEEGDRAGPFKILHIPGHTQGSVGLYDEKTGYLFSGDTLFKGDWGRTDLPGGSEEQIRQSLKRLLSMDGEIIVCPGHGPTTSIKEELSLPL